MKTVSLRERIPRTAVFIVLLVLAVSFVYPLFYMLINSLKTRAGYGMDPFGLPKEALQVQNYLTMISQFKILALFRNTFIVCIATLVLLILFGVIASYAFAKLKFRGQRKLYLAIIMTIFIPAQVTMIPMYVMFSKMSLVNNFLSVILAYLAAFLPEAIMLMTANFRSIPNELIEASEIDGCRYLQIIQHVIIPVGRPAIFLTIIFYFIIMWNDLFTPMILLQKMDVRTVTVALATLIARYTGDPPFQFAGLMLSAIPALLVYIVFQRYIISGLTVGAIK